MKKKLIGILMVMLFITTAVFPLVNATNIKTSFKKEKTEMITNNRPKIWVSIPDVHIYSKRPFINWGTVEFDNPGTIIDVDLSSVEGDKFDLGISQNIICHFENQFLPLNVIYTIEGWFTSSQPIWGDMNTEYNQPTAWLLIDKVDSFYPIDVWITGAPFILVGYLSFYWFLHMIKPNLPMCPSEIELKYGTTAQYQLRLIT